MGLEETENLPWKIKENKIEETEVRQIKRFLGWLSRVRQID